MKRLLLLVLTLLLLIACQPTPEAEFVVSKQDGPLGRTAAPQAVTVPEAQVPESPASAAQVPESPAPAAFPARWEEVQQVRGATVTWRADVVTKADGVYPLYRVRDQAVDMAWRQKVLSAILPAPVSMENSGMTRADWSRQFQEYVDRMEHQRDWISQGFPDWNDVDEAMTEMDVLNAELQRGAKSYQSHIDNAPEKNETVTAADYGAVPEGQIVFTMTTGERIFVQAASNGLAMTRYPTQFLTEHSEARHEERVPIMGPFDEKWQDVKMSRADAEAELQSLLETLGLADFAAARTYQVDLMAGEHDRPESVSCVAAGWSFQLVRSFGGCPVESNVYLDDRWIRHDGAGDHSAPFFQESLQIILNEDGVWYFSWWNPKAVVGLEAEAADLLSFDQARVRIKNAFSACLDVDRMREEVFQGADPKLQVWRVMLTPYVVRLPNSEESLALPCYLVFFDYDQDWRADTWARPDASFHVLVVSALDGGIIDPVAGY